MLTPNAVTEKDNEVTLHEVLTDAILKFGADTQTIALGTSTFSDLQILLERANNDFILKLGDSGSLVLADEALGAGVNLRLPDGSLLGANDLMTKYLQKTDGPSVKLFGPT